MDKLIHSKLGKLRILCSLPLFSDSICVKRQSAAEHGFTQIILSMILAPHLNLSAEDTCELIELAIFAEFPKVYLGDPSFYLRDRHPEAKAVYNSARSRIWVEVEKSLNFKTTRSAFMFGLHDLIDAFAASLYVEKESLLGNQFFKIERQNSYYSKKRTQALEGKDLLKKHPAIAMGIETEIEEHLREKPDWAKVVNFFDSLFDEANNALEQGGIGEYSATFLGMFEKLKEHFRYKGWDYHYPESVGAHTFQVTFLSSLIAMKLNLSIEQKIELYHSATLHDLAEAYASDVIFPVKVREKDMGILHKKLENQVLEYMSYRFQLKLSDDPYILAIVEACDKMSAELYFDRERRSGNTAFRTPNISMQKVREHFGKVYPEIFKFIDELWEEYYETQKDKVPIGFEPM